MRDRARHQPAGGHAESTAIDPALGGQVEARDGGALALTDTGAVDGVHVDRLVLLCDKVLGSRKADS